LIGSILFVTASLGGIDGISKQSQKLLQAVASYLQRSGRFRLKNAVKKILEKEAACFGPDVKVDCSVSGSDAKIYTFDIHHKLSKSVICQIKVEAKRNGSFKTYVNVNPNHDGCIVSAQDGSLSVGNAKEAIFVIENSRKGKRIRQVSGKDIKKRSKNIYKILELPSLYQAENDSKKNGTCGYFSLYHLLQMKCNSKKIYKGEYDFLLDRRHFEPLYQDWKKYIQKRRRRRKSDGLSNREIEQLIRNKVDQLVNSNITIFACEINSLDRRRIITLDGSSIQHKIRDFRKKGTPQYLIVSTSQKKGIHGISLDWDNRCGRLTCIPNHWIAISLHWEGKPEKSPVKICIADSGGSRDNRFAALIHWYYYLFVQSKL